jgi:hypothetical protein
LDKGSGDIDWPRRPFCQNALQLSPIPHLLLKLQAWIEKVSGLAGQRC